jgi:hypothetical protein
VKTEIIDKINVTLTELRTAHHPHLDPKDLSAPKLIESTPEKDILDDLTQQLAGQAKALGKNGLAAEKRHTALLEEVEALRVENLRLIDQEIELKFNVKDINVRYKEIVTEKDAQLQAKDRQIQELLGQRKALAEEVLSLKSAGVDAEAERLRFLMGLKAIGEVLGDS